VQAQPQHVEIAAGVGVGPQQEGGGYAQPMIFISVMIDKCISDHYL
jgi:hypothetical protein